MHTFNIISSSGTSLSASSSPVYVESAEVILDKKYHDGKRLALSLSIANANSGASGSVDVYCAVAPFSGSTYVPVICASGTSLLITSATSISGEAGNGTYYVPLTIMTHNDSGATVVEWLTGGVAPHIKLGTRASYSTTQLVATLMVG